MNQDIKVVVEFVIKDMFSQEFLHDKHKGSIIEAWKETQDAKGLGDILSGAEVAIVKRIDGISIHRNHEISKIKDRLKDLKMSTINTMMSICIKDRMESYYLRDILVSRGYNWPLNMGYHIDQDIDNFPYIIIKDSTLAASNVEMTEPGYIQLDWPKNQTYIITQLEK